MLTKTSINSAVTLLASVALVVLVGILSFTIIRRRLARQPRRPFDWVILVLSFLGAISIEGLLRFYIFLFILFSGFSGHLG